PDYTNGMRAMFFSDTSLNPWGYNITGIGDMTNHIPEGYWHYYVNYPIFYPTIGGYTVKEVSDIEIYSSESPETWNLELNGKINEIILKKDFEDCVGCHHASYIDSEGKEWEGIPLWYLMGAVDDDNTHGSSAFNTTIAEDGYDVDVIAGDGYSKTFNSTYLSENDSYIVACYLNGSDLPGLDDSGKPLAPLKLVGQYLLSGQKVSNIINITLDISSEEPPEEEWNLTVIGDTSKVYTLSEVLNMPSYTAYGGLKKSTGVIVGPYEYEGVNITYLADLVGGISPSDSLKVTASDGYAMSYTYDQIMGNITTYNISTGEPEPDGPLTMVLAYNESGSFIPSYNGGPFRIAFIGPDSPITEGHYWIKYVNKIEVIPEVTEWNLTLSGKVSEIIDRPTFESCVGCHGVSWTDLDGNTWSGVPAWMLLGAVDDMYDTHGFNDTVANEGYGVDVIAGDGYTKTFESTFLRRNGNVIVANELNGIPILEGDSNWPLRLTGPDLQKSENVKSVQVISLEFSEYYELTISVEGNGSTIPGVGTHSYPAGTVVDLDAISDAGWQFDNWSGDISTSDNLTTIEIDSDKSVSAHFSEMSGELESYGYEILSFKKVKNPELALEEPDDEGAKIKKNGKIKIEFASEIEDCDTVSVWASGKSTKLEVFVSEDGSNWTKIGSKKCISDDFEEYNFTGNFGDVRYIKYKRTDNGRSNSKMFLDAVYASN
ncbi:MAG: hypothetical protein SVJ22_10635, partial [Halobacteriota archaeon]|nr:hypothetical protein [Halobacteriota archaeon]